MGIEIGGGGFNAAPLISQQNSNRDYALRLREQQLREQADADARNNAMDAQRNAAGHTTVQNKSAEMARRLAAQQYANQQQRADQSRDDALQQRADQLSQHRDDLATRDEQRRDALAQHAQERADALKFQQDKLTSEQARKIEQQKSGQDFKREENAKRLLPHQLAAEELSATRDLKAMRHQMSLNPDIPPEIKQAHLAALDDRIEEAKAKARLKVMKQSMTEPDATETEAEKTPTSMGEPPLPRVKQDSEGMTPEQLQGRGPVYRGVYDAPPPPPPGELGDEGPSGQTGQSGQAPAEDYLDKMHREADAISGYAPPVGTPDPDDSEIDTPPDPRSNAEMKYSTGEFSIPNSTVRGGFDDSGLTPPVEPAAPTPSAPPAPKPYDNEGWAERLAALSPRDETAERKPNTFPRDFPGQTVHPMQDMTDALVGVGTKPGSAVYDHLPSIDEVTDNMPFVGPAKSAYNAVFGQETPDPQASFAIQPLTPPRTPPPPQINSVGDSAAFTPSPDDLDNAAYGNETTAAPTPSEDDEYDPFPEISGPDAPPPPLDAHVEPQVAADDRVRHGPTATPVNQDASGGEAPDAETTPQYSATTKKKLADLGEQPKYDGSDESVMAIAKWNKDRRVLIAHDPMAAVHDNATAKRDFTTEEAKAKFDAWNLERQEKAAEKERLQRANYNTHLAQMQDTPGGTVADYVAAKRAEHSGSLPANYKNNPYIQKELKQFADEEEERTKNAVPGIPMTPKQSPEALWRHLHRSQEARVNAKSNAADLEEFIDKYNAEQAKNPTAKMGNTVVPTTPAAPVTSMADSATATAISTKPQVMGAGADKQYTPKVPKPADVPGYEWTVKPNGGWKAVKK